MGKRPRKSSSRDSSEENYRNKRYIHNLEKEVSHLKRRLVKQTNRHDDARKSRGRSRAQTRDSGKERLRAPTDHSVESSRCSQRLSAFDSKASTTLLSHRSSGHDNNQRSRAQTRDSGKEKLRAPTDHSVESSRSSQRLSAFDSRASTTLLSHRSSGHDNNRSTESSDDEHTFLENESQFDPSENHGTPVENVENHTEGILVEETVDKEIMEVLGEIEVEEKSFVLHSVIKKRWLEIFNQGLGKEERAQLLNKHVPPSNLSELRAPEVNLEILSALPDNAIKNDKFHISRQLQLSKGLAALGMAMNLLLKAQPAEVVNIKNIVLANLSDAGKILADLHYRMSLSRRALLVPHLNKTVKDVTTKMPVDELLFGANLGEKIKAAKAVERSGKELKQPSRFPDGNFRKRTSAYPTASQGNVASTSNSLNYRGLPREPRYERPNPQVSSRGTRKMSHRNCV